VLPLPDDAVVLTGWFSGAPDFDPGAGARIIASLGRAGASDAFVARYDAGGGLAWVTRFGEATTVPDRSNSGAALARDAAGNLLVGGRFFGTVDFDPGSRALRLTSLGASDGFLVLLTAQGALATTP